MARVSEVGVSSPAGRAKSWKMELSRFWRTATSLRPERKGTNRVMLMVAISLNLRVIMGCGPKLSGAHNCLDATIARKLQIIY
jgi:hypothetical protein